MPAEQAIRSLTQALAENPATNVLVASEPAGNPVFQLLNLREDLADEFLSAARAHSPTMT
jgi:hypothetical protein